MKTTIQAAAAAITLIASSAAHAQDAVQWRVQDGGNGNWYAATSEVFPTFWSAHSFAVVRGGHLVTLTSSSENEFVASLAPGEFILGGYQDLTAPDYAEPSGGWRWVTNEAWAFTAWNSYWVDEPNNGGHPGVEGEHYLMWWRYSGDPWRAKWNDGNCGLDLAPLNLPALIEWSADCNSDGVVDYGQILQGQLIDADANGVPDICEVDPCPGDITNGGTVDAADLSILLAAWGTNGRAEFDTDIDNSGLVDGGDLALVLGGWGPCPQ